MVDYMEKELISYGFGSNEVRVVETLPHYPLLFAPYVPCFLDFLSVVVEHEEKLLGRSGQVRVKDVA